MGYAEIELPNGQIRTLGETPAETNELDPESPEALERRRKLATLVISGGKPYILIVIDPDSGEARLTHHGFADPSQIGPGLAELARELGA